MAMPMVVLMAGGAMAACTDNGVGSFTCKTSETTTQSPSASTYLLDVAVDSGLAFTAVGTGGVSNGFCLNGAYGIFFHVDNTPTPTTIAGKGNGIEALNVGAYDIRL